MKTIVGVLFAVGIACAGYFGMSELFLNNPLAEVPTSTLIEIAEGEASIDRLDAIAELGRRPENIEESFAALAFIANSPSLDVKEQSEQALLNLGEPVVALIRPYFQTDKLSDYQLACAAVKSIGRPGNVYLPELTTLIKSEDAKERRCGLYALQGLGEDCLQVKDLVFGCLGDSDFSNQCMACRVVMMLGPKAGEAQPALIDLLENGGRSTSSLAAECLAEVGIDSAHEDKILELVTNIVDELGDSLSQTERGRYVGLLKALGKKSQPLIDSMDVKKPEA
jgi:hypothetical protein